MIFVIPGGVLALLGAVTLGTVGTIVGIAVLLAGFLAGLSSKQKDSTITTWRGEAEALEARAARLAEELEGAQDRADTEHERRRECEKRIAHLEGEIKTLQRYTAEEALTSVSEALAAAQVAIVTAIEGAKELSMRNLEVLSKIDRHLGGVGTFDDDLPPGGHDRRPEPSA